MPHLINIHLGIIELDQIVSGTGSCHKPAAFPLYVDKINFLYEGKVKQEGTFEKLIE